ncbi:jg525 [Pararge aegeria aegeria]|uniref:Jg525 protein n=1 Tax=Pararge aegeria aegeria TaxID=348720 RepID=A0A8S4QSR0_9NEOP|nr:jg525 [Pararge aegeria aegeria]
MKRRLSTTCLKRILEYFGHIARRDGDNLENIVVTGKVEGKRPRGRSPIRWSDQIRTALDTKVHTALNVAQSRVKWHKIVQKVENGTGHDPQQRGTHLERLLIYCHTLVSLINNNT